MLGDVLLINDLHKSAAQEILHYVLKGRDEKLAEDANYKYIIAISGESGSGKSELSHSLALLLKEENIRVKILHADNYYQVPPLLRKEWRLSQGYSSIGPEEYDWDLLYKNIFEFKNDMIAHIPCVDIVSDQVDELTTDFQKINVLIIDGLYAIKAEDLDLRIFIELTYHETKMMQLMRGKEVLGEHRMAILEQEHKGVLALKPKADLLINKSYDVVPAKKKKA